MMKKLVSTLSFMCASLGWLSLAWGHHILGIPHYKYSEEYPQIPFVEVIAQTGPYDLDFTYYPGTPKPGEPVRFKLYVKNRETNTPYRSPLEVRFLEDRFLSDAAVLADQSIAVGTGPEANDYKFYYTFDRPEAFFVELAFEDGDRIERIPFPVTIGETDDRPLIGGAFATLLLSVAVVGGIKRAKGQHPASRKKRRAVRAREVTA